MIWMDVHHLYFSLNCLGTEMNLLEATLLKVMWRNKYLCKIYYSFTQATDINLWLGRKPHLIFLWHAIYRSGLALCTDLLTYIVVKCLLTFCKIYRYKWKKSTIYQIVYVLHNRANDNINITLNILIMYLKHEIIENS